MKINPDNIVRGCGILICIYLIAFIIIAMMGCGVLNRVDRTRTATTTQQQSDSTRVTRYDSTRSVSRSDSGGFTREIIREYRRDSIVIRDGKGNTTIQPVYLPANERIKEDGNWHNQQSETTQVNWGDSMRSALSTFIESKTKAVERKPDYIIPAAILIGLIAFAFITKNNNSSKKSPS